MARSPYEGELPCIAPQGRSALHRYTVANNDVATLWQRLQTLLPSSGAYPTRGTASHRQRLYSDRPRIVGTRISVQQIVTLHKQGFSVTDVIAKYEALNLAQVYAALAYYYANQAEIETYLAEEEAEYERLVAEQIAE